MKPLRILLVDDHALFRAGLSGLLSREPDMQVVAEATNGADAVTQACELCPDVVVMDIGMEGLSSFAASAQITKSLPQTKVVFLTMHDENQYLVQSMKCGAAGYVLKDCPAPQLLRAIREVVAGGSHLSARMMSQFIDDFRGRLMHRASVTARSTLTPREREILKALAEGQSVKEIATDLNVSVKTVEAHKFNLMRKLNIHKSAHLVQYAIKEKIIQLPPLDTNSGRSSQYTALG